MRKLLLAMVVALLMAGVPLGRVQPTSFSSDDLADRARAVLAQTSGHLQIAGLAKSVDVFRDEWGIAHIYAESAEDLFFAQGFVAAQDRLWQMDIWRRTGQGKLAEILGPSALPRDKFARLMRYRGDMDAEWKSYAPDARQIVTSFVHGINAMIDASQDRLPIEFQLTGTRPEPWTPEDCISRMAGYIMTMNASSEVARSQAVRLLGADKASDLLQTDPKTKMVVPSGLDLNDIDSNILKGAGLASSPISFATEGSNNWVVDGKLTASGKPLLANDPHRTVTLPSLRYLVHLVAPGWNVIGAGEPALPGIAAGHNERIGFGFTIVGIDQQDLYVEETNPGDPAEYRYKGRWEKMRAEHESVRVKGKPEPVDMELRFTRHGPVVYENTEKHRAYSLKWVGSEPGTAGYLAALSLDRATNWREFLAALERWKVPSENLVYADVDGNIGWQAAGLAPIRKGWSGLLPVPGSSGNYEWAGFLPSAELPRSYNPQRHFIATANHNIMPQGYGHILGYEWAAPYRFRRIEEVLRTARNVGVEDFERLQHDKVSLPAREIVPLLRGVAISDGQVRKAAELLLGWDFVLDKDSIPAAIYEVWLTNLSANVFRPLVGPDLWPQAGARLQLVTLIERLTNPDKQRFGAEPLEKRDHVLTQSLAQAVDYLRSRLGNDMDKWRWGAIHTAEFKHPLSTDDRRRAVLDLKPVSRGGDGNTVMAAAGPDYHQTAGASFREILDLSDWDRSVASNVPGQSGQPGSPHYGDLLPLWAEGRYFRLLFSKRQIQEHSRDRLTLEPKRN
jgi:penicillin amidase